MEPEKRILKAEAADRLELWQFVYLRTRWTGKGKSQLEVVKKVME